MNAPTEKLRTKRVPIMFTEGELAIIDEYRFSKRFATRASAIRHLVIASAHQVLSNQSAAASSQAAEAGEGVRSSASSPAPIPSPERGSGSLDSAIFTARVLSGDSRSAARGPLENAHERPTGDPIHEASHD